jgi:CheY-like chemotaxis protein
MRTPMNVIVLGLELASSQVRERVDPTEILRTLHELEFASSGALEILDNLLLYEKLERSDVELETTVENSLELLCTSLKPLLKIASAGNIELNVVDPSRNVIESLKDTQLKVDKTLLPAMIRTLVSRAMRDYKTDEIINIDLEMKSGSAAQQRASLLSMGRIGTLRLVVPLAIPLSYEELDLFHSDSLKFKREANEGGGGFALSMWISKRYLVELLLTCVSLSITNLTRRVVALHGGKIGVLQHEGQQALFVDLPRLGCRASDSGSEALTLFRNAQRQEASQRENDKDEERRVISSTINFLRQHKSMQLLVVDDSALNRKMIVQAMKSLGHVCIEADDGSVAVDIMRKALADKVMFDAVLMDNVGLLLCVLMHILVA